MEGSLTRAGQAGAAAGPRSGDSAIQVPHGGMHQGDLQLRGGLVQERAGGRIIGGIYEHLAAGGETGDIVGRNDLHQGLPLR